MGLLSRLKLVEAYNSPSRNFPFSANDLVRGIIKAPCHLLAPRYIQDISETEDYLRVRLLGIDTPLYWPKILPLFDLHMVVTETFYPYDWHFYEVPETRVSPGDVVFDCGAAEGMFSLRVLERAGHIAAFEPLPLFVDSLKQTFAHNSKVTVVPHPLGSAPRAAFLAGTSIYAKVNRNDQGIPVQITTVDKWVKDTGSRVDFLKGDLEAYEFEVLQGASQTIRQFKPKIAFTVYHEGNEWRQMLSFLRELVPEYAYRVKGLSYFRGIARPVMIHLWPT